MNGFETYYDIAGDLRVLNGEVFQLSTGIRKSTGLGSVGLLLPQADRGDFTAAVVPAQAIFVGGSGRNLVVSGLPLVASSTAQPPVGFFVPTVAGKYVIGPYVLEVTGPSAATISDATDVVAILTTGGTAPVGDYDSTVYGAATYNGTVAFTLAAVAEGAGGIPGCIAEASAPSTALSQEFVAVDEVTFEGFDDSDWGIVVAPDGSAELRYLTDVIGTRAAGLPWDPSGAYAATAFGMATFNLTDEEPVDGEPWTMFVRRTPNAPSAGYGYLELVYSGTDLDEVIGPVFGSTLPTPSGSSVFVPLFHSDGAGGVKRIHTGLLVVP